MIAETLVGKGYISEFHDFSQRLSEQASWLIALRREGYSEFGEAGFPTTHDEDWRFTNVAPIAQTRFALLHKDAALNVEELEQFGQRHSRAV